MATILGKLNKMRKDIQRYGANRNQYALYEAKHEIEETKQKVVPRYMVSPDGCFRKYWNIVIVVLLLYTMSIMPYRLCFEEGNTVQWFVIEVLVDTLFFIDILITFNSALYSDTNELVSDRKRIAKKYLKGWFFIDLLACVPFQLIETEEDSNKLFRLLRIPRIYRLLKILRLAKMIRLVRSQSFVKKLISHLKMNAGIIRVLKFVFSVLVMVHLAACLWYYLATIEGSESSDTWLHRYKMINNSNFEKYFFSIYYVFTTLTTVGYGDITGYTNMEKIFAIFLMGFGAGFYSYMIGNLSNIIATLDMQTSSLQLRINALNELSKAAKLPMDLRSKVERYLEENYSKNLYNIFDLNLLIKEIPTSLKSQISDYLYKKVTEQIYFFKDRYPSFLAYVIPLLKVITSGPKDYLYHEGDLPREVYFLIKGRVTFRASNNVAFRTYASGSYFGEVEFVERVHKRDSSVQVVSHNATFYVLTKEEFFSMMEEFPDIAEEIQEVSKVRLLKHEACRQHVLLLEPDYQPVESEEEISITQFANQRKQSAIFISDEFEARQRTKNKTLWANAIEINSPLTKHGSGGDYELFLKKNETAIHRMITKNYERERTLLKRQGSTQKYARNQPQPQFKSPVFFTRIENSVYISDDGDLISSSESEEVSEIEQTLNMCKQRDIEDQLINFEDVVADNTLTINSIKTVQASIAANIDELIKYKDKGSY